MPGTEIYLICEYMNSTKYSLLSNMRQVILIYMFFNIDTQKQAVLWGKKIRLKKWILFHISSNSILNNTELVERGQDI